MMGLPLAFAEPLVLIALAALPALWWLLRLIPPRPRRISFPPARMLFDIAPKEETPARTPWWLTLLRLTLAALLILAAAGPMWNPPIETSQGKVPMALLIDDGWSAAAAWDARVRTVDDLISRAETDGRGVALVPLSETTRDISLETAGAARVRAHQITPKPHTLTRADALPAIKRFLTGTPSAELIWLSDGVDVGQSQEFLDGLAALTAQRSITVVSGGLPAPRALTAAENAAGALSVKVLRPVADGASAGLVRALDLKGLPLGDTPFSFNSSQTETEAQFNLPVELRNDISRLEIVSEHSAGAVQLLDKRWRRRTVGVVTGSTADTAQPLLASNFYLSRALNPFADVRLADKGSTVDAVNKFIDQHVPMMILADVGNVSGEARDQLLRWVESGGVLVRFAGPRLAAGDDDLVPVKLRRGGRVLGGSLSWDKPQQLASFSRESPFVGMAVPEDVTVTRQVLAEPEAGLGDRTWAALTDGTPLVTAAKRGKGVIVLFHVTADARWSNLPLSGVFVDMLKRLVGLSGLIAQEATPQQEASREFVPPTRILNGFGAFGPPPVYARPVPVNYAGRAKADNPPGFYGPPEGLLAVNTLAPADRLKPLDLSALKGANIEPYRVGEPMDLRAPLLVASLALLLIDGVVVFWLSGGLARLMPRRASTAALLIACVAAALSFGTSRADAQGDVDKNAPRSRVQGIFLPSTATGAQPNANKFAQLAAAPGPDASADEFARKATAETHLAYVITGDAEVDNVSRAGLQGLTLFLGQRTALEAGEPMGLDISKDELSFFPLIYWPIAPKAAKPSPAALARIDAYMKQGGTILFDTRDAVMAPPGPGGENRSPGMIALRGILSSLDIPELEPIPRDHVLAKTFYLLRDFPGRFNSGQLWVEALQQDKSDDDESKRPARGGDGVSSIIITSNDLAGAWAQRPDGQPMLPLAPGEPRQREFAFRAGVNIVMYTLTGNYKADQVHVPALIERLGQ